MTATWLLEKWDKAYVWHPFTPMQDWCDSPITIVDRARGSYLVDTDGKRYLDGVSSLWCNMHGHRVPALDRALREQIRKVAHSTFLGLSNVPAIRLSKKLVEIAPRGLRKVFYSDSGSEAVEIALKITFQYWQHRGERQRTKFLRFENAYHGDTLGSVSVGGIGLFHEIFRPLLFKTYVAPSPYLYREGFRGTETEYAEACAGRVRRILEKHGHEIAAIIMEPLIQGASGMITHPRGFLKRVRRLADQYGVLLILDEVATGFGRTGRMFACGHEGVRPDILCLAKGLTGGYLPLGATLVTDEIYNRFLGRYEELKTFFHGHTYTANPLACAAAIANINVLMKNGVMHRVGRSTDHLARSLQRFKALEHVGDIRQKGLMVGIELVKDRATKEAFPLRERVGPRVTLEARRRGLIIRPLGNVIVLMPPLSFTLREISQMCNIVYHAIRDVTGKR